MIAKKIQQVRSITQQIFEFVEAFNIEGCQQLLQQRLVLLEEIKSQLDTVDPVDIEKQKLTDDFNELLFWLEDIDTEPMEKVLALKQDYQEKLSNKKKANFAIKQYTST